ncbi:MAG TPA: hypothetical protein VIV64_10270 [Gammaproteobacteria bacterium]|jgi:hypothetical protein
MQRRAVLKGLVAGMPVAAGAAAAASAAYVKDKGTATVGKLEQRLDALKARFDEADRRNQKLVRIALGAAALSLGVDVGALL